MPGRILVVLLLILCAGAVGWTSVRARESVALDSETPVRVGAVRVAAAGLGTPRRAAADRAIERLWLEGEAKARGLDATATRPALRHLVADALAGERPPTGGRKFAAVFDAFHARWRSRTRCLGAYQDPYTDRCGNHPGAAAGTCRWMGEGTLCALGGRTGSRWLVLRTSGSTTGVRFRSQAAALTAVRRVYMRARTARAHAERAARADALATTEAERKAVSEAQRAYALRERRRDPRLTDPVLAAARDLCRRQLDESEPYLFGFGTQDPRGQANELWAARARLMRRLAAVRMDRFDRRRLRSLVAAIETGSRYLAELSMAAALRDTDRIAAAVARFGAHAEREGAISARLGLGDCLARPA